MKLLELCLSPGSGGLELYARRLVRFFSINTQDCLAVVSPGTSLDEWLEQDGISRRYLSGVTQHFPIFAARKLAELINRNQIDTVHFHWRGDLALAVLAKKLSRRTVRLVYTRQMALTRPKFDFYHRFLYRNVDLLLTITKQLQEDARRLLPLPPDRVRLLYYGVPEPGEADPSACAGFFRQSKITPARLTVGLFGRIEHGKGQHLLVSAVKMLCEQGHDVAAVLIGHVMEQDYFDRLMNDVQDSSLADRITYAGFHDHPPSIMGCFDVIVLATKEETFGLVLAEAMRAGTAVIGSNAGGVPEIIVHGETGLLFEPENAADLARCLERLVIEPELKESLARQGKHFADTMFSEERHFEQLQRFLADTPE